MSNSLRPHGLYSPWNSPGQNTGMGSLSLLWGSSQPRDRTQVSHIAGGFFTTWSTRETKNTGVGSLSFLQQIFPTQEWNQGMLHYRWILFQLNYEGSQFNSYIYNCVVNWSWYILILSLAFISSIQSTHFRNPNIKVFSDKYIFVWKKKKTRKERKRAITIEIYYETLSSV